MMPASVSVVVPVYRGASTLFELVERLQKVLGSLTDNYEIILVNDGSPDQSWEKIRELSGLYPQVRGISLSRNFGQHNALLAGICCAQFDFICTLDDDLQNPPEEIPLLLSEIQKGYEVVYGSPVERRDSLFRRFASLGTRIALSSIAGEKAATHASSFRIFRSGLKSVFERYQGGYVSVDALLGWATTSFGSVKVKHDSRAQGKSNYHFGKLLIHSLTMLTGYSILPLRVASIIGGVFLLFGFGIMLWVMGRYLVLGGSIPGFPFLASIITLFSGAQLFSLGVIGEYLGRMHFRVMDRPTFLVKETTQLSKKIPNTELLSQIA